MPAVEKLTRVELLIDDIVRMNKDKAGILKKINHPKMGWFSVYTPEEVIYAAGLIPFRITGETYPAASKARAAMFANLCPYILSCLEEGMQGAYDFIDGVVTVNTCDARRRLYDTWRYYVNSGFVHLIDLPKMISPDSKAYFRRQILLFIESLQNHFGCKITEDSLGEAIILCNRTRELLNRLYDLRKEDNPPVTGVQAINIVKSSMVGLRKDFNEKLTALLDSLKTREINREVQGHRLLFCGSYFDQTGLIDVIEKSGATVVCEDLSNGIRYFEGSVSAKGDPATALADYYLEKGPCARWADSERRFQHIRKLVEDYKVDAVIYFCLKFCDTNLIDFPYQKNRLNQMGIPVLFLEGERSLVNSNQLKTRIQAFLEINGN